MVAVGTWLKKKLLNKYTWRHGCRDKYTWRLDTRDKRNMTDHVVADRKLIKDTECDSAMRNRGWHIRLFSVANKSES